MSVGPSPEERRAPPGEVTPASPPTVPPAERAGPYQPPAVEGSPEVPGYEILSELGRGGMGVVYQARQVALDRRVALKFVLAGAHADADDLARFRREAEAIARLRHPNVVEVYEVGDQGGVPHLAMELCPGGSLARQLAAGPLAPRRAAALVETLARAVQAAHEAGVIHRDLNPANVLLTEDGTPKITDFGLARRLDGTAELTATGAILGTPSYMAPEQASGDSKRVGPAADVYALGAVLYACLTGRPPFRAATLLETLLQVVANPPARPSRLRPGVPAPLEAICLRCLRKKPGQRFPSAAALADALRRFCEGQPPQVRPRHQRARAGRPRPGMRRLTACVGSWAGSLLLLCLLGVVFAKILPAEAFEPIAVFAGGAILITTIVFCAVSHITYRRVHLLAFSPDGNTLASADGGNLKLWDVAGEHLRLTLDLPAAPASSALERLTWLSTILSALPHTSPIKALAFSSDGRTLVTLDATGGGRLWDVADGRLKASFRVTTPVKAAAFGPGGRTLATVTPGRWYQTRWALTLWDVDLAGAGSVSRRATVPLPPGLGGPPADPGGALVFVAEGTRLGVLTSQGLRLWDILPDGLHRWLVPDREAQGNRIRALSPDGRMVGWFVGMRKDREHATAIGVWDLATDRACCELAYEGRGDPLLRFAPDGRVVASWGCADGEHLWDPLTGRHLGHLQRAGKAWASAVAFAPDGRTLAVGDTKGGLTWHDVAAILRAGRQRSALESGGKRERATGAGSRSPPKRLPAEARREGRALPPPVEGYPAVPGYEVLGELGRGGMGVVYQARQVGLDRLVALKVVLAGAHADADDLARFRREAEAIARLHHPNVVTIYEAGEHHGLPYLAMELCPAGSLVRRLADGPLAPRQAATWTAALARGVHAAHQAGIIHRDLKPANVLLTADGTPKVTDFGLAKKLDASTALTRSGDILGTPSYMAPEQAGGRTLEVGPASDVYALGAVLYACLTARPPFHAATPMDTILQVLADPPVPPSRLRRQVPAALEAICLKCLAKDPSQRYPSAAALADDLERFLAGALPGGQPPPADPLRRAWRSNRRWQRRLRWATFALLAVAGLCLVLAPVLPEQRRIGWSALLLGAGLGYVAVLAWLARAWSLGPARALAFRPEGGALAVGHAAGSLRLWDLDLEEVRVLVAGTFRDGCRRPAVRALAFRQGAAGEQLAALDAAGTVKIWDLTTLQESRPALTVGRVTTAAFSPDGRWLACAAGGRSLVWRSVWGRWAWRLVRWVGLPGPRHRVWLWDLSSEGHGLSLDTDARLFSAMTFAPFGPAFAALTETGLRLYRLAADGHGLTEQTLAGVKVHPRATPAFTPDGRALVVRLRDGSLKVWEVATGRPLGPVRGPTNGPALVYAPDGRSAATLNADGTASLWDLAAGQEVCALAVREPPEVAAWAPGAARGQGPADLSGGPVRLVAFSPDGQRLALADEYGSVGWCDVAGLRQAADGPPKEQHRPNQPA
jgi:serine/threonine protein kinase/WD40 repeat protein